MEGVFELEFATTAYIHSWEEEEMMFPFAAVCSRLLT